MSTGPQGLSAPENSILLENSTDREARNPFFRWVNHLGAPLTLSILAHLIVVIVATFMGGGESKQTKRITVDEYSAQLVEQVEATDSFTMDSEPELMDTPEEDSLDDLFSDVPVTEVSFDDTSDVSTDLGEGTGFGDGDKGGLIGTGSSGIGEVGLGGFGDGMGGRTRMGSAGVWDLDVAANKICYVVDFSGSLVGVIDELKRELKRSIGRLRQYQTFNVVLFYGSGNKAQIEPFKMAMVPALPDNKKAFNEWIDGMRVSGGTYPLAAMKRALNYRPEAVFFFSDGLFDPSIVDEITQANQNTKAQIVCFLFDGEALEDKSGYAPQIDDQVKLLKRLAAENVGRGSRALYKTVTIKDLYGG